MISSLDEIRLALSDHRPTRLPSPAQTRDLAAVALCLAGTDDDLHLCLIRRSERAGDPWSGHMALPGGRAQPEDPSPRAVAEREVEEEVGLELVSAEFLTGLADMPVRRGGARDGVLRSFVYYLGPSLPAFRPCSVEVAAAFWIPLAHLWDETQATSLEWIQNGRALRFSGIAWGEDVVWGLTHQVLYAFATALRKPLLAPKMLEASSRSQSATAGSRGGGGRGRSV